MNKKEQLLREILNIYKIQAIDLSIMYKIEFGDDVIAEIKRLQDLLEEEENSLTGNYLWSSGEWVQPPVPIKHGDVVEVECDNYSSTLVGRYIGKGCGIVELYDYTKGTHYVTGHVVGRGINKNPRLISDEKLLQYIKE